MFLLSSRTMGAATSWTVQLRCPTQLKLNMSKAGRLLSIPRSAPPVFPIPLNSPSGHLVAPVRKMGIILCSILSLNPVSIYTLMLYKSSHPIFPFLTLLYLLNSSPSSYHHLFWALVISPSDWCISLPLVAFSSLSSLVSVVDVIHLFKNIISCYSPPHSKI